MFVSNGSSDGAIMKLSTFPSNGVHYSPHNLCQDTAKMRGYGGYYVPFVYTRGFTVNAVWDNSIPVINSKVCVANIFKAFVITLLILLFSFLW